jgi:hypothetical protein
MNPNTDSRKRQRRQWWRWLGLLFTLPAALIPSPIREKTIEGGLGGLIGGLLLGLLLWLLAKFFVRA